METPTKTRVRKRRQASDNKMGDQVRQKRLSLGLTQTEVAQMMGVDQRSVSSIELGVVDGSIQTKARVADFLGVPLQDVLRWTGDLN